jgi:16S rRNA processing protein RimM
VPTQPQYVPLAIVARPHGVRGELKLKVYNLESDVLLGRPPIRLALPDGSTRDAKLSSIRRVPGAMLATLRGVEGRDAAEALRGASIEVSRSLLGETGGDDEFFVCDLIGCAVIVAGESIGVVEHVQSYPSCDALVVTRKGMPRLEVPLVSRHVGDIDLDARRIEVLSLEGLS